MLKTRTKEEIQKDYDEGSEVYDEQRFYHPGGKYIDETEKSIVLKSLKSGSVLELGTGTSRYGVFLAKQRFEFTGIDISKGMLTVAKEKAKEEKVNLNLFQMDAEKLGFSPCTFDNVICIHALRFIDPLKSLNEAYRVLKPGGRFIAQFDSLDGYFTKLSLRLKEIRRIDVKMRFYIHNEVEALFKKTGFDIIAIKDLFNFPSSFYHIAPEFLIKIVKKIDNKLKRGDTIVVVGKK